MTTIIGVDCSVDLCQGNRYVSASRGGSQDVHRKWVLRSECNYGFGHREYGTDSGCFSFDPAVWQILSVFQDISMDALKAGMLFDTGITFVSSRLHRQALRLLAWVPKLLDRGSLNHLHSIARIPIPMYFILIGKKSRQPLQCIGNTCEAGGRVEQRPGICSTVETRQTRRYRTGHRGTRKYIDTQAFKCEEVALVVTEGAHTDTSVIGDTSSKVGGMFTM
ncbi:hypothetical protein EDD85DRAFT_958776 [Armillaria nabsnona]|nr:hypothetical protein EDD85DRAFT_958776 [Armillaria nabsnona]